MSLPPRQNNTHFVADRKVALRSGGAYGRYFQHRGPNGRNLDRYIRPYHKIKYTRHPPRNPYRKTEEKDFIGEAAID